MNKLILLVAVCLAFVREGYASGDSKDDNAHELAKPDDSAQRILRGTVIPDVAVKEETLQDRIATLEHFLRKANKGRDNVRFVWSEGRSKELKKLVCDKIEGKNMSVMDLLVRSAGDKPIRFSAKGNSVMITHASEKMP